jgi:hypothetical protein
MKEGYIEKIINQLPYCDDVSLLDFIFQLLKKRSEQTSPLAASQE